MRRMEEGNCGYYYYLTGIRIDLFHHIRKISSKAQERARAQVGPVGFPVVSKFIPLPESVNAILEPQ